MEIVAVVFDFDGVITDSANLKNSLFTEIARNFNVDLGGSLEMALENELIGAERRKVAEWLYRKSAGQIHPPEFLAEFKAKLDLALSVLKVEPGFQQVITYLRNKRIPAAILSNAPYDDIIKILELNGIDKDLFSNIVGASGRPKCFSAMEIAKSMNLKCPNILFIGDTSADEKAAADAGMQFAWFSIHQVQSGNAFCSPGSTVFRSHFELLEFLKQG